MFGTPSDSFLARCSLVNKFFQPSSPPDPPPAAGAPEPSQTASAQPSAKLSAQPSAQSGAPAGLPGGNIPAPTQSTTNGSASAAPSPSGGVPASATSAWRLKPEEAYAREQGVDVCRNKQYFRYKLLPDLIARHPPRKPHATTEEADTEAERRRAMLSFLFGLLQYDTSARWTPRQAIQHPFITGAKYTGRFAASEGAPSPAEGTRAPRATPGGESQPVSVAVAAAAVAVAGGVLPPKAPPLPPAAIAEGKPPPLPPGGRNKPARRGGSQGVNRHETSPQRSPQRSPHRSPQLSPRLLAAGSSPVQRITLPVGVMGGHGHAGGSPPGSYYGSPQSTSPPAYFPSPPMSLSPPSMQTIHVALSGGSPQNWQHASAPPPQHMMQGMQGGWAAGAQQSPPPAMPVMVPMSQGQHAPQTFFGVNTGGMPPAHMMHHGGIPQGAGPPPPLGGFGGGYAPDGIHLASSPPDRSSHGGTGGVVGNCAQCGMWRAGFVDERDRQLYCHTCWGEYHTHGAMGGAAPSGGSSSESEHSPQHDPYGRMYSHQMYAGYQQGPGPAPPMRLAVNTGGPSPPAGGRRGDRQEVQRVQARRPNPSKAKGGRRDGGKEGGDKKGENGEPGISFDDIFSS